MRTVSPWQLLPLLGLLVVAPFGDTHAAAPSSESASASARSGLHPREPRFHQGEPDREPQRPNIEKPAAQRDSLGQRARRNGEPMRPLSSRQPAPGQPVPRHLPLRPPAVDRSTAPALTSPSRSPPTMDAAALRSLGRPVGIAIGIVATLLGVLRIVRPPSSSTLPRSLIRVYGKVPITAKQHLYIVRFGPRLVLLSESSQGFRPVCEIHEPAEVEWFLGQLEGRRRSPAWRDDVANRLAGQAAYGAEIPGQEAA